MENLREDFLKVYANTPIKLRDEIIMVLDDGRTVSWDVIFFEVKQNTELSKEILKNLKKIDLI